MSKTNSIISPNSAQTEDFVDLSVLVPVYGVERYIRKAAESLFAQTLKEGIEFIFVDDCSPDRSMEILQEVVSNHPERAGQVKILRRSENGGLAAARLSGLEVAHGEYVIHCDSDDWVEPETYETMLSEAREKEADVVVCDYIAEFPRDSKAFPQNPGENSHRMLARLLNGTLHCSLWNKLIRRDLYSRLPFVWEKGVNMWEDVMVLPRLVYFARGIAYIPRSFYHYNQQLASASTRSRKPEMADQIHRAWQTVDTFILGRPDGMSHSSELEAFRTRALYSVLTRSERERRPAMIEKFREGALHWPPSNVPFGRFDRMAFRLLINGHNRTADFLLSCREAVKKLLRGKSR